MTTTKNVVLRAKAQRRRTVSERATEAIVRREVQWCRAKLLHALAGADAQGVLADVLGELLPDEEGLAERMASALAATGWR